VRTAAGVLLFLLALPVGAYGLLYIGAIWTSDTSTTSLATVGALLLALAIVLLVASVWLLRGFGRSKQP